MPRVSSTFVLVVAMFTVSVGLAVRVVHGVLGTHQWVFLAQLLIPVAIPLVVDLLFVRPEVRVLCWWSLLGSVVGAVIAGSIVSPDFRTFILEFGTIAAGTVVMAVAIVGGFAVWDTYMSWRHRVLTERDTELRAARKDR
ncbi:hypothetical protein ACT17_22780 [Mycolicibacterium conceptionense]|uniref:Transmembrane protein n=2 Tax=Mycolicibacterium conceptionense TaxID=451644 RepID=A0A0J8U655_9MYCO|nr:hypothetical protein ACT17_22780 [Mycolicibacterium conceptionense]